MPDYRRIEVSQNDDVSRVRFVDHKLIDPTQIQEMGEELNSLVSDDNPKLLLSFPNVEFLSSGALNKLIIVNNKVKGQGGSLKLCDLRPEILEVFSITRLNKLFDIYDDEDSARAAF